MDDLHYAYTLYMDSECKKLNSFLMKIGNGSLFKYRMMFNAWMLGQITEIKKFVISW